MARALEEIVRLDRRWFRAHPERRHRCRWPDTGELDLYDSNRGAPLVMAIRYLGRGRVVYQPVIFQGAASGREISCGAVCARSSIPRADSCHRPSGGAATATRHAPADAKP